MKFKVASAGNNSSFGDLLFTLPSQEAINNAEKEIYTLCNNKIKEINGNYDIRSRFEQEFKNMGITKTAIEFLLLKEIADLSNEMGYPIMLEGNVSGSVISYLLEITSINPMSTDLKKAEFSKDLIWYECDNTKKPDFSFEIAAPVREQIHKQLNKTYSYLKADESVYKNILMPDSVLCEKIGKLQKNTSIMTTDEIYQNSICLCAIKELADDLIESNSTNKELLQFAEELKRIKDCDFDLLIRIFGYIHGSFDDVKTIENLYDNKYYILQDEFYSALIEYKIPQGVALNIVKHGVWATGEKKQEFKTLLEKYDVTLSVIEYFDSVKHLWPATACASRVQLLCTLFWYQNNYSAEFTLLDQ